MRLAAIMHRHVVTIAADAPVRQARELMTRHGIGHLPVVEAGGLVGLLTERQVRRVEASILPALAAYEHTPLLASLRVRDIMTRRVIQRHPDTPVQEAAWLLWEEQTESILVVDDGDLIGIVTASDLLQTLTAELEHRIPITYDQIMVPTDFDAIGAQALSTALVLAHQHQARLILLHVLRPLGHTLAADAEHVPTKMLVQMDSDRKAETLQRLEALVPDTLAQVLYQVSDGLLVAEIIKTAVQVQADIIVMGCRRQRGLKRFLGSRVVDDVLQRAPCPVLIVKA